MKKTAQAGFALALWSLCTCPSFAGVVGANNAARPETAAEAAATGTIDARADQNRFLVDAFGGGRAYSIKKPSDLQGTQRWFFGKKTETWIDPVVHFRLQAPLGRNLSFQAYSDLGGFEVGSDLTWQLTGVVQYDFSRKWSLSAGWRHLDNDYDNDGVVFNAAMDGPILAAVYRF